jgi:DNA-binding LytR/AlgR family response regulator
MLLKTLIVDDEPIARRVLREELDCIGGVEVIGEAANGLAALEQIAERRPDLVLLDLQMPEMGGLDVARGIRRGKHVPVIVIVTAYDKYALQAFDAGAIDYLLKPVGQQRLAAAVERAKRVTGREAVERLAHLQEIAEASAGPRPKKIVGKVGEEWIWSKPIPPPTRTWTGSFSTSCRSKAASSSLSSLVTLGYARGFGRLERPFPRAGRSRLELFLR